MAGTNSLTGMIPSQIYNLLNCTYLDFCKCAPVEITLQRDSSSQFFCNELDGTSQLFRFDYVLDEVCALRLLTTTIHIRDQLLFPCALDI